MFRDPARLLLAIEREQSQRSLHSFVRAAFPIVEKGRTFVDGWMIRLLCRKLQDVAAGKIRRIVFNVPPGTMKSTLVQVMFPAWCWGPLNRPNMRFLTASYSPDITIRDNRRCRDLIRSPWYRSLWGDRVNLISDQNTKTRFDTSETGFKIATSTGGMTVGERGDVFVTDDPHNIKNAESDTIREETVRWGTEIVPTRIIDPEHSAIVLIMQRVHERDLSAYYIDLGFEVVCLPMEFEADHPFRSVDDPRTEEGELLFPERYSREYVDELKAALSAQGGDYAVSAQLQQRPVPRGGGLFKRAWFKVVDHEAPAEAIRVRGWDLAASTDAKAAWTAGTRIARTRDGKLFVEDVVRVRADPHDVISTMVATARADGPRTIISVPQDPGQAGLAQKANIAAALAGYTVWFSPESGSKMTRALPFAAQAGAGNVYVVRAPWTDVYLAELCMFDKGPYADQVDATTRAHAQLLSQPNSGTVGAMPPILIKR